MNKKIEDAAKKYIETGRGFDMDSLSDTIKKVIFKDGAEWALREAIAIVEPKYHGHRKLFGNSSSTMALRICLNELEQLLSSEDKNDKPWNWKVG